MGSPGVIRTIIVAAAIATLELICRFGFVAPINLIPPSAMVAKLWSLMHGPVFWLQVTTTLKNVVIAALLSWTLGFVAGVVLHGLPRVRQAIEPLLASYYAIPIFAFYPLAIVLLGMNSAPIIIMAVFFAVVAMMTSTMIGLDRVPLVLARASASFHLGPLRTALFVQLPAILPYLFSGAKLSLGYSVAGVIGSEFILSDVGLGFSIAYAYNDFDSRTMYAYLLFVLLFVAVLLGGIGYLERLLKYRVGSGWTITAQQISKRSALERCVEAVIIIGFILAVWQTLSMIVGGEALASPAATFNRLFRLIPTPRFWEHATETGRALGISLIISCVGGLVLGTCLGASPRAGAVFEPMIVALQSTPKVTLYPIMLLFFGLGLAAKVAYGAIHGIIPMTLITMNAIRSINPALMRSARVFHLSRTQTFATVLLPAALPEIVTAFRLSFSITFLGVMVGELFASQKGLGFMIMSGIRSNDVATIMAVILVITLFAVLINSILLSIDRLMHR